MTNYHPDVQRAYESHCADGYVVPDDETGPQEATGGAVRDFPCCDAPRDGEAAERRTASQIVIKQAARVLHAWDVAGGPCEGPWEELTGAQREVWRSGAQALAAAGLLADPAEAERRENVAKAWAVRWMEERDDARGALDETLDDLTRTLARAEKAEAEVERWQRLVSWHERHGSDAEDRARRAEAERDRARDTAAALEAEVARLVREREFRERAEARARRAEAKVERVRQTRDEWGSGHLPIHWRGFAVDIDRALSDTTGEATR